jgi:imidazolonepropionase-like amidohydrolase
LGTLESGKLADLILVKEDPLENIRSLENVDDIVLVMKDGQIVKNLIQQ